MQNSNRGADVRHKDSGALQSLKQEMYSLLWIFKNLRLSHVLDIREYMKVGWTVMDLARIG